MNVLEYFDQYQNAAPGSPLFKNAMGIHQAGQFEFDAMNDRLPAVSWIIPTSFQCEHPNFLPAAGADYIASKIDAIAANQSVWEKTVFVLIYDENDGLFDHVLPPTAPPGTPDEFITVDGTADPIGLGFRVPCVVLSPWTVGGYVSHATFDHTSVIRLIESVTGVSCPSISAWRRSTSGDLAAVLGNRAFSSPRLPGTQAELVAAEEQVRRFTLPPIPGSSQTFPIQPRGTKPVREVAPASGARVGV
jgi:phospholipase C